MHTELLNVSTSIKDSNLMQYVLMTEVVDTNFIVTTTSGCKCVFVPEGKMVYCYYFAVGNNIDDLLTYDDLFWINSRDPKEIVELLKKYIQ